MRTIVAAKTRHFVPQTFEKHRDYLIGVAYRLLGSKSEAEDAVQDAWIRWQCAARAEIDDPRAYLVRTVTHLCLDQMKAARNRREVYVGPWLPEPLLADETLLTTGSENASDLAADLSYAFMLALEWLSPTERAAFLLHDVFDVDYPHIALTLSVSEVNCRQMASRARAHLRKARKRFVVEPQAGQRLIQAFIEAARSGDISRFGELLAEDVRYVADGGGKVTAAKRPLVGRTAVAKLFAGIMRWTPPDVRITYERVNTVPGFVFWRADGTAAQAGACELTESSRIAALYLVRNPEKLRHLGKASSAHHRVIGEVS